MQGNYKLRFEMKSQSNEQCANCKKSYLSVNGRFCSERKHYVEYAVIPPCKKQEDGHE